MLVCILAHASPTQPMSDGPDGLGERSGAMHWTRLLSLLTLLTSTGIILAACGNAPGPQTTESSTAAPVAIGATTAETAPTAALPAPTAAPTVAPPATSAPLVDTNPARPDDATQARLRVSYCVSGPQAAVFVNGKVAMNGGMPQDNLVGSQASGYLYLVPGTYSIAIVPTGMGLDKALFGPLDVPVVAGHRYTVVELGQADESSHKSLVIDE